MGALANLFLLAIAFIVVGAALVLLSLTCFRPKQHQALGYVTTEGSITHGEVAAPPGDDPSGFAPVLTWQYEVKGVSYRVKGYSLSARTGTKAWAEGIVAEHPAGSQCTVHYDPDRPDRSVLNVEPESTPTVCLGTFDVLGFVVAGIGVLLLLVALALYLTSGAK